MGGRTDGDRGRVPVGKTNGSNDRLHLHVRRIPRRRLPTCAATDASNQLMWLPPLISISDPVT